MLDRWSRWVTFIFFVVITGFGFFFWVFGLIGLWFFLQVLGFKTDLWAMIEALSTAVAAAAVLSAGFIAYRELTEAADSRHVEIADRLFTQLNSEESIEARRRIYQNLSITPEQGVKDLTPEDRNAIKHVLNTLDRVAFLTQKGWIPDEIVMPWMHPMIAKSWEKLEPFVEYERERRNEPYYYEHAGKLAERCREWRKKNLLIQDTEWVEDAL